MTSFQVITEAFVNVMITTNVSNVKSERKFAKDLTVFDLKGKLELITGAVTANMDISVYDKDDESKLVCTLDDNDRLLGSYPVDSGMILFIKDRTKTGISNTENGKILGEFEDVSKGKKSLPYIRIGSPRCNNFPLYFDKIYFGFVIIPYCCHLVEKYELTPEAYSKRTDTVQSYLKRNNMGKYNEEEMKKFEERKLQQLEEEKQITANFKIGDRCEIDVPGAGGKRRGAVTFIGETKFKPDCLWIGVRYDEPVGKNDGSVEGQRYNIFPTKALSRV